MPHVGPSEFRRFRRTMFTSAIGAGLVLTTMSMVGVAQEASRTPPRSPILSCMPPHAQGIFILRPGAIFRQPGMAKYAPAVDEALRALFKQVGFKSGLSVGVENVELLVGAIAHVSSINGRGTSDSLGLAFSMIRTRKACDWNKELEGLGLEIEDASDVCEKCYRLSRRQTTLFLNKCGAPPSKSGKAWVYFVIPDGHTLVSCVEPPKRFLGRFSKGEHDCHWAGDWEHVEHCLAACAFSTDDVRSHLAKEDTGGLVVAPLLQEVRSWAFGLNYTDRWQLEALAACQSEEAARRVKQATTCLLSELTLSAEELSIPISAPARAGQHFVQGMVRAARTKQKGATLQVHSEVRDDFTKVFESFLALTQENDQGPEAVGGNAKRR